MRDVNIRDCLHAQGCLLSATALIVWFNAAEAFIGAELDDGDIWFMTS